MLMLGWNPRARILISELNEYAAPGSVLTVIADSEDAGPVIEESSALANLTVDFRAGDATDRRLLDSLDVSSFDAMLVLSEMASLDPQQADARTLVTLLHLRDIATKSGRRVPIVSEMLDDRNRELAQVTKVDDVIVSEKVISLILAQISQNAQLATVFDDLLSAAGSEIHIRPVDRYISGATSFATIVEAAKRRGETAIGYRTDAGHDDPAQQFGVRINPAKSTRFEAAPGDRVIVLAED